MSKEYTSAELTCKHCDKPIMYASEGSMFVALYRHTDGLYACYGSKPVYKVTYAEPKEKR